VNNKPLLILDLDETLIYASLRPLASKHDFRCASYYIHKRPFVHEFLETCAGIYDLAVWTSSTSDYARCVRSVVFGERHLEFLWARDRCTRQFDAETREHYWVKDLKKVKRAGYDLRRVLTVDDTARNLERSYGNLVVVDRFLGDPDDRELPALAEYLAGLSGVDDFRSIDKRLWRKEK
jgi:RNA polymerase II subunit A small phosphatase-like protein